MTSAIFDLQAALILSTMFRVNWHFHSATFLSTSRHDSSYQVSSQQEKMFKLDFQDGGHDRHFDSASERFWLFFIYKSTCISYQVSSQLAFGFLGEVVVPTLDF